MNPAAVMKSMIPVVMAGVIGIYGLIVAVIIVGMSASPVPVPLRSRRIGRHPARDRPTVSDRPVRTLQSP